MAQDTRLAAQLWHVRTCVTVVVNALFLDLLYTRQVSLAGRNRLRTNDAAWLPIDMKPVFNVARIIFTVGVMEGGRHSPNNLE